jgi:hypothetical protein
MAVLSIQDLLVKFGSGKSPRSADYVDLIDSLADDRNAVYFSATAPADTEANPLWFNTSTNVLSIYDGGWIEVGGEMPDLSSYATTASPTLTAPKEKSVVSATAATGTINYDVLTQGILYYTTNSTGNWTLNLRGNSSTTLNSAMSIGETLSVVFMATNGATAYYPTAITIDGSAITPKLQGGTAISSGNINSIDIYSYSIFKTASSTYTALSSQTKFA